MEKVRNWSNLTTVNFVGGLCGDFICSLVYNSYYNNPIILDKNVYKASFNSTINGVDTSFFRMLFLLSDLFQIEHSAFKLQNLLENHKTINFKDKHYIMIKKIFDQAYDQDQICYEDNVKQILREIIPYHIDRSLITHQSYDHNLSGLHIQSIFPGSKNVLLTTSKKEYFFYFKLLAYYKYYKRLWPEKQIEQASKEMYQYEKDFLQLVDKPYPYHPFDHQSHSQYIPVYVDKFLFDDNFNYVKEMEDVFSSCFNQSIRFDKDQIVLYRDQNKRIISNYLNCDVSFDYQNQTYFDIANDIVKKVSRL